MDTHSQTLSPPIATADRGTTLQLRLFWQLSPLALLWLMAVWGLADHWRLNPQYNYGWLVPVLAAYTAYERWKTRPAPGASMRAGMWLACTFSALLLPMWLFILPNPAWPLLHWIFVAQVATITLGVVATLGGWSWLRHFSIPVLLMFTAVPWPDQIESPIMQFMKQTAASIAVAGLDVLGVTTLQHGNVLEVVGGSVGVDDACSGIRSFQGSLAASLILGELFRFDLIRRAILVALSIGAAFVINSVRVGFLAWNAAHGGANAVDQWHDSAGTFSFAICVVVIWAAAFRLETTTIRRPFVDPTLSAHPLPRWFAPLVIGSVAISVAAAELWYFDPSPAPEKPWGVRLPAGSKPLSLSPNVWVQLRYDAAIGANWSESGRKWSLYFFDWDFGPTFSRVSAQNHRPDICLPAVGLELQENRGKLPFQVDGESLSFHAYSFKQERESIYVYHGVWPFRSERGLSHGPLADGKHAASLQSVIWRERRIGQQALEVAVWGCRDAAQADATFAKWLPQLLHRRPPTPPS